MFAIESTYGMGADATPRTSVKTNTMISESVAWRLKRIFVVERGRLMLCDRTSGRPDEFTNEKAKGPAEGCNHVSIVFMTFERFENAYCSAPGNLGCTGEREG